VRAVEHAIVAGVLGGTLPVTALLALLAIPLALRVSNGLEPNYDNPYGLMAIMGVNIQVHLVAGVALVVAYVALPFDVISDRIPILGQIDDLVIIAAGMTLFVALTPRHVLEYHLGALE